MSTTQERKCNEWPLLSDSEIESMLQTIPKWNIIKDQIEEDKVIKKLQLKFSTRNFVDAMSYIQEAGNAAEAQGHHPGM